jgi:two-component system phosphate regulon sensor histidine kinase PhoR
MFLRLFIAFIAFSVFGSALFGVLLLQGLQPHVWNQFLSEVLPYSLLVPLIALVPAYFFAKRFHRPLQQLMDGAVRISDGEYGHLLGGGSWGESRSLAKTFNEMSRRLADQFDQLETDRQQLRTILGGMVEAVIAVDGDRRIVFANEAAGRFLEFDPERAVGRPFWELSRQPLLQEVIDRALSGTSAQRVEVDLKGPNSRHLAVYAAPMPSQALQRGAVLVANDISELRRLERLRQDFVANVSHELKTPLSVIKACVEALLDGAIDDVEVRKPFLDQVSDQADRLHALILDMLSLARIESGEEMLDLEDVSMSDTVIDCLERHRPRADAKSIELHAESPPSKLKVRADAEALFQILDNLVDNAVKYTPEKGKIQVRWNAEGGYVSLQVQDTGPGIPERDLPRIFERFYRVDKARSREVGGTGLGLAIVKHLVQAMKGSIQASSQLGRGTIFTVRLPEANRA